MEKAASHSRLDCHPVTLAFAITRFAELLPFHHVSASSWAPSSLAVFLSLLRETSNDTATLQGSPGAMLLHAATRLASTLATLSNAKADKLPGADMPCLELTRCDQTLSPSSSEALAFFFSLTIFYHRQTSPRPSPCFLLPSELLPFRLGSLCSHEANGIAAACATAVHCHNTMFPELWPSHYHSRQLSSMMKSPVGLQSTKIPVPGTH